MKVLVTGGSGFVGKRAVAYLKNPGWSEVINVTETANRVAAKFRNLIDPILTVL